MKIRKIYDGSRRRSGDQRYPAKADLVFATDAAPYPPFTSQNAAGEWEGWEYDLLKALCAEMNEKCTLIPIAWDGIIPALLEKKMDGIFGSMSITDERKKQINFSDMYYNSASVIIGAEGRRQEHFAGSTSRARPSACRLQRPTPTISTSILFLRGQRSKAYKGQDEANADLAAGRVDYVQADGVALRRLPASRRRQGMLRTLWRCSS